MSGTAGPRVAVFRPDDARLVQAMSLLQELGMTPVADPMLEITPSGETPRRDADIVILTSRTGADLIDAANWEPGAARVCAIGEATAEALRSAGYHVDMMPAEFSSNGLVEALREDVPGRRVEIARSDHGSQILLDGLSSVGAYVHETVLYELGRPSDAGHSTELAADGRLDAALFSSSLTVAHFLESADARGVRDSARAGLESAIVGAIGEPTRRTAAEAGIEVDVVPERATFEELARAVVDRLAGTR